MKDFGVCYCITEHGDWPRMLEMSMASLPAGTPVELIRVQNMHQHYKVRLGLVDNLPFRRTLFADADVLYFQKSWPDFIFEPLAFGVAMTGWLWTSNLWREPIARLQQLFHGAGAFGGMQDILGMYPPAPIPSAGLMLIEEQSKDFFARWRRNFFSSWDVSKSCEMAYAREFSRDPICFDWMPPWFHIPHRSVTLPTMATLPKYHFVHMLGPDKVANAEQCLNLLPRLDW